MRGQVLRHLRILGATQTVSIYSGMGDPLRFVMKEKSLPRFLLPDLSLPGRMEIEILALSELRSPMFLSEKNQCFYDEGLTC